MDQGRSKPNLAKVCPTVYLLSEDPLFVEKTSLFFREHNVVLYVFGQLKELWPILMDGGIDLLLVDTIKQSDGHLILRNHPKIKEQNISLVFYCAQDSSPLIKSTLEYYHLGVITQQRDINDQLIEIVNRWLVIFEIQNSLKKNEKEINRLKQEIDEVDQTNKQLNQYHQNFDHVLEELKLFEMISVDEDFFSGVARILNKWKAIEKFSFYVIRDGADSVFSPKIESSKYVQMESFYTGIKNSEGLNYTAQSMITNIANKTLGHDWIPIPIFRELKHPICFILLKLLHEQKRFNRISYLLGKELSFLYCRRMLFDKQRVEQSIEYLTPHEFFGLAINSNEFRHKVFIKINFSSLMNLLKRNRNEQFFWRPFLKDFISAVKNNIDLPFQLSVLDINEIYLFFNQTSKNLTLDAIKELKKITIGFSYWKYFELENSTVLEEMIPKVSLLTHDELLEKINMKIYGAKNLDRKLKINKPSITY